MAKNGCSKSAPETQPNHVLLRGGQSPNQEHVSKMLKSKTSNQRDVRHKWYMVNITLMMTTQDLGIFEYALHEPVGVHSKYADDDYTKEAKER
jgi:hypothetical protein